MTFKLHIMTHMKKYAITVAPIKFGNLDYRLNHKV